mmetsp:Transcript_19916/g.43281  ORF Transcript_19916/g.43281 Transcript_19916/m.43281 type:complete len:377 (-) Transcript_19916:432-1562(-)|eukprot:CAMPEP_0168165242 /NCGR_PEP_ID=MMETSP0139_2-20121125/1382_1 /TAXON_ID=44445 /ORGANISM="Pseudo-nitzschia australis, Strain 10249 10 AB" /LENGTH=376 /DNA_ID=CAMNT_0008082345 /DNA_START=296 /DNA_END=1426 /DNA_ORIENTATION=-
MAKRKRQRQRSSSSSKKRTKNKTNAIANGDESSSTLCFQDVWDEHCSNQTRAGSNDNGEDADVSNVFFELANAPSVSYRLQTQKKTPSSSDTCPTTEITTNNNSIVIKQDVSGAAETHTGGIVWETSYLLLNYLLSSKKWMGIPAPLPNAAPKKTRARTILEIGAGCGMLGISLHKAFELGIIGDEECIESSSRVILTETNEVMDNLRRNLEQNYPLQTTNDDDEHKSNKKPAHIVSVDELDWTRCKHDCSKAKIEAHSIDCIVGTDVVFSTRFVLPMLETMQYLSHPHTVIYLCLQERCKDSHQLLLKEACCYGFRVNDISKAVYENEELAPSCRFGRALECKLLKLTVISKEDTKPKEKMKKEKKKKQTKSLKD